VRIELLGELPDGFFLRLGGGGEGEFIKTSGVVIS
jgi:hypothetical protein